MENLINLCINNRKLIGNLVTKVNNQHLNLYLMSEKYKKLMDEIEKYSYINLISELVHYDFELIKLTNMLFVEKNCYYDSTFGLEFEILETESSIKEYKYSKNCLKNVKTNKIIFASMVSDDSGNHMINFDNNVFTINENDIPTEIIIMPGTNLKTLYINKDKLILHLKDYVKILVSSDNPIDANAMTIHLSDECQLDAIIIDEPTELKRSNKMAMYINAKNFVFESTFNLGSMENYTNLNRNIYANYKLLDISYELDSDIRSGFLTAVKASDYGISNVSYVLRYVNPDDTTDYQESVRNDGIILDINKFESLRGYITKMMFVGLQHMKQYLNDQGLVNLLFVREMLKVPGIADVVDFCNVYIYYDVNCWRSGNLKVRDYVKVAN